MAVLRLLQRCMQKDLARRLRDIGDARIEIEEALASKEDQPTVAGASARMGVRAVQTRRRFGLMLVAALLLGAALAGGALWVLRAVGPRGKTGRPVRHLAGSE